MVHKKAIAKALRGYNLELLSVTAVRGGFLLETDRGRRFFKVFPGSREDIEYVRGAIEHLVKRGFSRLNRYIFNKYGEPYSFCGDRLSYLCDWIEGREIDFSIPGFRRDALSLLTEIHDKSAGYILGRQPYSLLEQWRLAIQESMLLKDKLLASSYLNEFDQLFLAYNTGFIAQGRLAAGLLEKSEYTALLTQKRQQGGFCHRAFYGRNVLRDETGDYWVVDFDHCGPDLIAAELGKLLLHYLPNWDWSPPAAKQVVEEYSSMGDLPPEEEQILWIYLCFPHEFFNLCQAYKKHPKDKEILHLAAGFRRLLAQKNKMFALTEELLQKVR